MLKVTNNNTFDLNDRYNGQDFSFPAGKTVALDLDAARHIFGFGEADKIPYLTRQGWMRTSGDLDTGMRILGGFVFDSVSDVVSGELILTEQGSAPLQAEEGEAPTDAASEPPSATPSLNRGGKRNILDQLAGA
jgi:hypothetical protein